MLSSDRGKVGDMNSMPGMGARGPDLEEHVFLAKPYFGFVDIWRLAVFESNMAEVVELVAEKVGDILGHLMLLVPQISGEPVHGLGGSTGVKLDI